MDFREGIDPQLHTGTVNTAVFVEIERAFNNVWHERRLQKLLNAQVPAGFVRITDSFLSHRQHRVRVSEESSHVFTPRAGLPKGSILFLIRLSRFADDTTLWVTLNNLRKEFADFKRCCSWFTILLVPLDLSYAIY